MTTAEGFRLEVADRVATVTLDRPAKKNPLTFELYATLRDWFGAVGEDPDIRAIVLTGAGGNFCSGGDVHEIIGPLVGRSPAELLAFTRMTGAVVNGMLGCPQPIVAAVDGVCVGAGAILAMASDIRLATPEAKTAFLFTRVGLAGCDMGACAILPRIIGHGRAAELLLTGRTMGADEAERCGFYSRLVPADELLAEAQATASALAHGPTFAHATTKAMLRREWALDVGDAIEAEAQAQAICMQTHDFERAYRAFVARERPVFEGD
jgi:enoyl-CoA hydratase/carnithine racemase